MLKLKTLLYVSTAAITMTAFIFAASCKKNKSTSTVAETTVSAADQSLAEKSFTDAQTISENAAAGGSMNYRVTKLTGLPCATVTRDTTGTNTVVTINFGPTDCICLDGRTRRGEIIITYPKGPWYTIGATHTITFSGYYQNDNAITGTKTVTYAGLNGSGQPYFNVTINGTVTYPSGKTVTASWTRVRTWLSGFTLSGSTPVWSSGIVYSVSGTGTMTNSDGKVVDITIPTSTPLVFTWGCKWIEAGTISYTLVSDGKTRSINYGSNTPPYSCDATAVVTLANGTQVTITKP